MGSDREARALGAGVKIEVGGKEYTLRPVVSQHLCDLELEALAFYRRKYIAAFAENAHLLGEERGRNLLEKKIEEAARWDLDNLPQKTAYDVSGIPLNDKVRKWIASHNDTIPGTDSGLRAILANALDTETLKPKELRDLSGKWPRNAKVRYDQWWITGSMEGMISFILSSLKRDHPEATRALVLEWPFTKIAEAARIVEERTVADSKNG